MSASHESDPFLQLVSTELATPKQLTDLENLAHGLLTPLSGELHRQYGHETSQGSLMLGTMRAEYTPETLVASVALKDPSDEDVLSVLFAADNTPLHVYYNVETGLEAVPDIAQSLLDDSLQDPRERAVLRAVESVAQSIMQDMSNTNSFSKLNPRITPRPLAEVIRELVAEKTDSTLCINYWELPLANGHELNVLRYKITPDSDASLGFYEAMDAPSLRIELIDKQEKFNHCFIKMINGEVLLHTYSAAENAKEQAADEAELDEVDKQMESLGVFAPTSSAIELLTEKLLEAVSLELETPDDLSALLD